METYRSGHNETDSKSVVPHGTVGSNPTASARIAARTAKTSRKSILAAFNNFRHNVTGFIDRNDSDNFQEKEYTNDSIS